MIKIVRMQEQFGTFCAVGERARSYLETDVLPVLEKDEQISFDFSGVTNMNSSFSNALFANLVQCHGKPVLKRIKMINTSERIKNEVRSSISLGLIRWEQVSKSINEVTC